MHDAETSRFGRRYTAGSKELKGLKTLNRRIFRHLELNCKVQAYEAPALAKEILDDGTAVCSVRHLKALAIAKTSYVSDVFSLAETLGCKVFASMVEVDAPQTASDGLRKDYAYLFQRFFYFLEDEAQRTGHPEQGIIVFDELEKSKSHILIDQAHRYFKQTAVGRARASLIVPEPFFVHSDLTTGIQIADLMAYSLSWGFRTPAMHNKPVRLELAPYVTRLARMRYRALRNVNGIENYEIWSIAHIRDLRTGRELDGL